MKIFGIGQIVMWPGGNLWAGVSRVPAARHAHHAIQICLSLSGGIRLRSHEEEAWTDYQAAFIPAHIPHCFEAVGSGTILLFCEPESNLGRQLLARFPAGCISPVPAASADPVRALFSPADFDSTPADVLADRGKAALWALAGDPLHHTPPTDPRILRAVSLLKDRTDRSIPLGEAAATVHLSPGRFRHLFVAEMGMPFRRYLLWLRLQKALSMALGGESWAQAAQAANFADQAHLSRTFRQMLGVAPTSLTPPPTMGPPAPDAPP
ncbi:helix-turn-helix transcriptional regulator [Novispirillum itersonii]|uniref:AraC-like DNA-binding protein n=1 Tax=Novispirillum itersonii TaxID=189 RepID=A0A7X0DPB4_NOVIT|nr:AraC family transcriptional regulator [Novispirillum itersonii]MBB6211082.1 AraC-like DNA-binding protein [Novispirillum itersonii]